MALTARLAHTYVKIAEVLGYLPWRRLYENRHDVTDEFTYIQLLERLTKPVRQPAQGGRSSGRH